MLRGIEVHFNYGTAEAVTPTALSAKVQFADLRDIVWITPDSMLTVNSVELAGLAVNMGENGISATSTVTTMPRASAIAPLLDAAANVMGDQITKTAPAEMAKAFVQLRHAVNRAHHQVLAITAV
jgi:hypothetical protein